MSKTQHEFRAPDSLRQAFKSALAPTDTPQSAAIRKIVTDYAATPPGPPRLTEAGDKLVRAYIEDDIFDKATAKAAAENVNLSEIVRAGMQRVVAGSA